MTVPGPADDDAGALQDAALTRSVLRSAAANPRCLPELLAAYAVRHMGPVAVRSVARTRAARPDAVMAELRALTLTRGKRRVVTEGAIVGGPLLIMAPFAFCAALLSQARTCLELAALEGQDATTPVRGAELLVLQGVHADVGRAGAALAEAALAERRRTDGKRAGRSTGRAAGPEGTRERQDGMPERTWEREDGMPEAGGRRMTVLWQLTVRMARVLGLVPPKGEATAGGLRRWLVTVGRYALLGAVFLVGMVAPLVWIPYVGRSYSRSTDRLLDRATAFYSGEPVARPRRSARIDPGMLAATVRALLSLLIPVGLVLAVVLADLRLAGSHWPVFGITLITASCAVAAAWQWRRHRRRRTG
ncbi:hypothetical protein [Streptomyces cinereospinus]|uniref:Uncharacterized protein n=1 Tax=Streptomyces cinereospinus TaxID=285561 RepID=A0ABV5MY58_9ACTN